ncbi:MAG: hypothetical protein ACLFPL_02935 [Candidatus Nanoarchaeia archaeon]
MNKNKNKNKQKSNKKKESLSYEQQREQETKRTVKILSLVLLIVMGLSVFGFSMIGTGAVNSGSGENSQNVPFTQDLFQDTQSGQTYAGAVIDGAQFIFYEDINEYENNQELEELAQSLKSYNNSAVYEYVADDFTNDDARILIAQALRVNDVELLPTNQLNCEEQPTLVFTHNASSINQDTQNCMMFDANTTQAFSLSNGLAYHLIKDIR